MILPSKELLSEVLGEEIITEPFLNEDNGSICIEFQTHKTIVPRLLNIYELMHMNLKEWAKINKVFDKIDWSGEPEDIILKANKIHDELN